MFKGAIEVERAERDQQADWARIDAAIQLAAQAITALQTRQLDTDEARKEWFAIRDRTIIAVRDVRRNIIKRAIEAKETQTWTIEKFFREKANGNPLHEFSATLHDIPTKGLLDYLCYLTRVGDPARVQCICAVFKARVDSYRYNSTFDRMLTGFAFAESGELGKRLARICHLAEQADARIADLFADYRAAKRVDVLASRKSVLRAENLVGLDESRSKIDLPPNGDLGHLVLQAVACIQDSGRYR
jgi:hypothetical protein